MKLTKTHKILIGIGSGLVGIALSYWGIYRPYKKSTQKKTDLNEAEQKAADAEAKNLSIASELKQDAHAIAITGDGFPLQYGSTDAKTGGKVSKLQQYLLDNYGADVLGCGEDTGSCTPTGKFLTHTDKAVRTYLAADGKVTKTWYDVNITKTLKFTV